MLQLLLIVVVRYSMMICLPPQGTSPHTAANTAHSAYRVHSQHCGHTALPRVEDKPPQTNSKAILKCIISRKQKARSCTASTTGVAYAASGAWRA